MAGPLNSAAGKFGTIAQAAQQAASAVQSLQKGGAQALLAPVAQALLAPIGQAALANVANKLPGGAAALNAYGGLGAGKPFAAVASTLGLPGSLPPIGAETPPLVPTKSVI